MAMNGLFWRSFGTAEMLRIPVTKQPFT